MHMKGAATQWMVHNSGLCAAGRAHMYDLSLSQDRMYEPVEAVRERMHAVSEHIVTIGFGHFGDGNLHLLVSDARGTDDNVRIASLAVVSCALVLALPFLGVEYMYLSTTAQAWPQILALELLNAATDACVQAVKEQLEPFIFEWTKSASGSISAEHGIGVHKQELIDYSQPAVALDLMSKIKTVLDPKNTLNPGKVVKAEDLAA